MADPGFEPSLDGGGAPLAPAADAGWDPFAVSRPEPALASQPFLDEAGEAPPGEALVAPLPAAPEPARARDDPPRARRALLPEPLALEDPSSEGLEHRPSSPAEDGAGDGMDLDGTPGGALGAPFRSGELTLAPDGHDEEEDRPTRGPMRASASAASAAAEASLDLAVTPREVALQRPRPSPPAGRADGTAPRPAQRPRPGGGLLSSSISLAVLVALSVGPLLLWRGGLGDRIGGLRRRPAALEPVGVRGGLYDAEGGTVLVVSGRVRAHAGVDGRIRVKVELLEGERVVSEQVGLAGADAGPEQVYAAAAPGAAIALRRTLDEGAVASLAAGRTAPFLFVFPAPAPPLEGLELRVAAEPADARVGLGPERETTPRASR